MVAESCTGPPVNSSSESGAPECRFLQADGLAVERSAGTRTSAAAAPSRRTAYLFA